MDVQGIIAIHHLAIHTALQAVAGVVHLVLVVRQAVLLHVAVPAVQAAPEAIIQAQFLFVSVLLLLTVLSQWFAREQLQKDLYLRLL